MGGVNELVVRCKNFKKIIINKQKFVLQHAGGGPQRPSERLQLASCTLIVDACVFFHCDKNCLCTTVHFY